MSAILFKKGDFLTQETIEDSYAIWDGTLYIAKDGSRQYSLAVYGRLEYNQAKRISQFVTDIGLDGKSCGYVVDEHDITGWRKCTQTEINHILLSLGKNKYRWDTKELALHRVSSKEELNLNGSSSAYNKATVLKKRYNRQKIGIVPMNSSSNFFLHEECDKYNNFLENYHPTICKKKRIKHQRNFVPVNDLNINFLR